MKHLIIAIITALFITSCEGNLELQRKVIEDIECQNLMDTTYQVSIPHSNKNYIYEIHNTKWKSTITEVERKKLYTNYKTPIGLTLFFTAWAAMLIFL